MTKKELSDPIRSIKEWTARVFPDKESEIDLDATKNDPAEIASLLAQRMIENLRNK